MNGILNKTEKKFTSTLKNGVGGLTNNIGAGEGGEVGHQTMKRNMKAKEL